MIDNTINDDRTVADGGKGMIFAGRYHILRQLGQGGTNGVSLKLGNGIIRAGI